MVGMKSILREREKRAARMGHMANHMLLYMKGEVKLLQQISDCAETSTFLPRSDAEWAWDVKIGMIVGSRLEELTCEICRLEGFVKQAKKMP